MSIDTAFTEFPVLTTDRLLLRQIQPTDAEALFEIFSDEETMKFNGHPQQGSIEETYEWIRVIQGRYDRQEAIRWGVTFQDTDRVIGTCSFHRFGPGYHRVEAGYELNRSFWGQGVMFEAMSAVVAYGFDDLNLHRIEAIIDILNERSKELLLRLGFSYEGNLRQRFYMHGQFEDEYYYGLLRDEWHRQKGIAE